MSTFYSGRVHSIIFENSAQDFYVVRMVLDESCASHGGKNLVVRGNVPGLTVRIGTWFGFEAKMDNHAQYGNQLAIMRAPVVQTWTPDVAMSVLKSNGVGELVVTRLHKHFGDDLVAYLDQNDPEVFQEVPGITPFAAAHILDRWKAAKAYFKTLEFLADSGIPKSLIARVWTMFGDDSEEILTTNPWALTRIDGITFKQADEVAVRLDLDMDCPERLHGAVLYACKARKGMGHLYMGSADVVGEVMGLIQDVDAKDVAHTLAALHKDGQLVLDRKTKPGTTAIYEPWLHQVEVRSAELARNRWYGASLQRAEDILLKYVHDLSSMGPSAVKAFKADPSDLVEVARGALQDWSRGSNMTLSVDQMGGALNALIELVSIITGLPGTGKTTMLKAVVRVLQDASVSFLLVAPTGIAAKRMSSLTGATASTIHRAFGAKGWAKGGEREANYTGITGESGSLESSDGSGEEWGRADNVHPADVIICDEASMVDQHLLYRLLSCTKPSARIVFVGDAAQLPSVGPGNVLRDLIASGLFPTTDLIEIFRQADTSDIVVAAHAVFNGEVPVAKADSSSDFVLLPITDEDQILSTVIKLASRLYKKRDNFQVLSPRHSGTLGVTNLNSRLRDLLNPKQPGLHEMRLGSEVIREDDRVMVVKNDYELSVFNGDVGKVSRLDRKARHAEVKIHGPPIAYVHIPFKQAGNLLRLAYCVTVHKMQGQEADIIVMPLVKGFRHQLQRNLLYTAITRAKKRVILVGHPEALERAVMNNRPDDRNTLFLERLVAVFALGEPVAVAEA